MQFSARSLILSCLLAGFAIFNALSVYAVEPLGFSKAFSPATVDPGDVSTLTFTIDNTANLIDVGSLVFTDTFPDGMIVAGTPNGSTGCGGTFAPNAADNALAFTGGSVAAGQACTISVDVQALRAGALENVSGDLASDAGNSGSATDTLTVTPATPLSFTKSFRTSPISAGGSQTMTFAIAGTGVGDFFEIAFTDNLSGFLGGGVIPTVTSLPSSGFCGFGSIASTSVSAGELILSVRGATLAGDSSCTFDVEFTIPADLPPGDYTNTTNRLSALSGLVESQPVSSPPASDTMTVSGPTADLAVTVTDATDPIVPGTNQVYTVQVTNNGPRDAPAVVGTFTLPAGTTFVSTSGCAEDPDGVPTCALGSIAASDSAGYTVTATIDTSTTGTVTASATAVSTATGPAVIDDNSANDTGSEDTEVTPVADISVTNDDGLTSVDVGGTVTYGIVVSNNGPSADPAVLLKDTFPDGLTCTYTSVAAGGASGNTAAGAGDLSETLALPVGGEVVYTATCTVDGSASGTLSNTATVDSSLTDPDNGNDSATDGDTVINPPDAAGFSKAFSPATVDPGDVSTLTFTIDNTANLIDVGSLAFTDTFPDGMIVAGTPNGSTGCGGTFAPNAADNALAFTGGSVAAGQACTISVDVQALRAGALENVSGDLASDLPVDTPGAGAILTVSEIPLSVSMAFAPATIAQGGMSRLSHTLNNSAAVAATSVALSDRLPADMVLAADPDAQTTCGGTLTAPAGGNTLAFAGGSVAAGQACTVSVNVTSTVPGPYPNETDSVTSSLGTSAAASATLDVTAADAPGFSRVFAPDTIRQGGETRIVFTIDNGANAIGMTGMAFDDALPAGVSVAATPGTGNSCGGTFNPVAGATVLGFADGALAEGETCELRVSVRAITAGTLTGPDVVLTSSLATATAAEATLTVEAAGAAGFSKAFSPATVDPGDVSTLTFTIDNTANLIDVGSLAFTDTFPDGMIVAGTPNGSTGCGGTFAPNAADNALAFTGGSVAAGQACTISVDVQALRAGALENVSGDLASDLPVDTPGAGAILTVSEIPLSVSMAFAPATIAQGGMSRLSHTLNNSAAVAATSVALSDRLPADMVLAADPDAQTTCGGTLTAPAGGNTLAFAGGSVAAGQACTVSVNVTSTVPGPYPNETDSVTSSLGTSAAASATLDVTAADAPGFSRVFAPDTIRQGGETRIVFTIDNGANAIGMTGMAFDDALPAGVSVAATPGTGNSCGGTFNPVAGATVLGFADGALAEGETCELRVSVRAITAGTLTGPDVVLTSSLATATAAEATLTVEAAGAAGFSKAFSPATVDPGDVSTLTFTIDNTANLIDVGSLAFTDTFPDGMIVAGTPNGSTGCGGTFAPNAADNALAFTGGSVAAGQACTISVDVQALRAGALENVSGDLASDLPVDTPGAGAILTVSEIPLSVSMAFAPATIAQGGMSRLSHTLNNSAAVAATSVALSDRLPADMVLAADPDAQTTCGGTLTAPAGGNTLAFAGGSVAAGQACTVSVNVTSTVPGPYPNETDSVTSSLGTSAAASATLDVTAADAPGFSRVFAPDTIRQGGETRIVFTIDNGANAIGMTGMAFDDALPAGVSVAATPGTGNSCGGTFNPVAGATVLGFADGALAEGETCELRVSVRAITAGTLTGPDVVLTSSLATATAAEATLTVEAAGAAGFSKAFSPATVDPGDVSTLTFTIDNTANLIDVGSLAFTDTFPDGMIVAGTPNGSTGCGGTFAPNAADNALAFTGGSVAAGQACTISVDVQALRAGALENVSGDLASDLPVDTPGAGAILTVSEIPLSVSMAFAPATIAQGGMSRLSHTLNNSAAVAATSVALSDRLPADMVLAADPDAQTTCGGTLTAPAGGNTLAFAGGSVAAGQACTVSVNVTSTVPGPYPNETDSVTSSLGTSAAASATLDVTAADAPGFSRVFAPDTIRQGGETRIVFTIDNGANAIGMTGMAFDDALPAGVSVAATPGTGNSCGGTFNPVAGATVLGFADGALAEGETCELRVSVRAITAGTLTGPDVVLTSSLATATAAEATLTVEAAGAAGFSKAFSPATVDPGDVSTLTFTIDNTANLIDVGSLAFTDTFPDGMIVAGTPNGSTGCGGTFAPNAADNALAFTGGSVAAGQACTISVDVQALRAGALENVSGDLASDLPVDTPGAGAILTVSEIPLSVSMAFAPATIAQGGMSRLSHTLNNSAAVAATSVALSDRLPADMVLAADPDAQTTCGGTLTAPAGGNTLAFAGGSVAAGQACTVSVNVTSTVPGPYPNETDSVTSSLGTSAAASATLDVTAADAPGFSRVFAPDTIRQGGETRIVFTIDNGANAIGMTGMAFDDALPAGVSVAATPGTGNSCGGTFNPVAGATVLGFADGALAEGETCELRVSVRAITAGTLTGPDVVLTSSLATATAAEATLTVEAAGAAGFSKAFSPATVDPGDVSTLTFTIDNTANLIDVGSLAFTDTFPDGMIVAGTPNGSTGCGGTFAPNAADNALAFTGGSVAAGQACTISVDVQALRAGALENVSGDLASDLPVDTPGAGAILTVSEIPLSVSMAFAPATIAQGGMSRLSHTLNNSAAVAATSVALSDRLPADMVLAADPDAQTTCGGTLTAPAGGNTLAFAGGSVAAGQACTVSVNVTSTVPGPYPNETDSVTSSLGTSAAASATLDVTAADAPGFSRVFAPDTIRQGGETRIVFTIDNGANAIGMTGMAFDDALPAGVSVAATPGTGNSCGGTFNPVAGATVLGFADGALAEGETCELRVSVRAITAGTLTGPDVVLTSSLATATAAEATLTVEAAGAAGFSKAFSPATVDPGDVSTLTFTIDNTANLIDVGSLAFTDTFPDGMIVAGTPNGSTGCGGTFAPNAADNALAFTGGSVAAGQACTISVDVQALRAGALENVSGDLASDLPVDTPGAGAILTVSEIPLSVSMAFAPATIAQGGMSRLSHTLNNSAAVAATSVALSDRLPADMVLAADPDAQTTCGGTLTAPAGGNTLAFAGGSVAAGQACTVSVNVTSTVPGPYPNETDSVTSSLGTSAAASATLDVTAADAGTVTFNVESDTDGIFSFSSAEPVLTISLEVNGGTGSTGALSVATGSYSVAVAAPTGVALTAMACDDTNSTADVSATMISVTVGAFEVVTCTLAAQSSVQPTVETINSFLTRRADLILSSESNPSRRFERLNRGSSQVSPLRFSNGDLKALVPFTGQLGDNGNFEFSTSLLQARQAAASVALASGSAGEVAYVENHRFDAWFEAQYRKFGGGTDEHGDFAIAYTGVDYLLTPDVLVGALVSLDTMEELTDTSTVSGFGYMFGPYMTAQWASNLYFDGHFAVGRSDNRINPFNTYTDTFSTRRWLARASLTGEAQYGNWTIQPHARLSYFEEPQQRYVDSVGATIPSQTVRLGQIKIGPTFTGRVEGPEGRTYSPYLEVEGIYNIGDTTGVTLTNTNGPEVEGWRARLKAGVGMTTKHGTRFSLGATYDGVGRSDFESWGLSFELSIPFGKSKAR